ncbi:MAG: hypothetical protein E7545_06520 [Ruminococcaceae bacterium]|nr:hypothetical protein [Oscillospiraceae bacterium]
MNNKSSKSKNYGYFCGALMLIATAVVTALIIFLSMELLTAEMSKIFGSEDFFKIFKALFSFLGSFQSSLHFGKGMQALLYLDYFCFIAAILGFVQGALFKKRDLIS